MGLKKFLRPDELFSMVSFFMENGYDSLDMDIVFNVKDKESCRYAKCPFDQG